MRNLPLKFIQAKIKLVSTLCKKISLLWKLNYKIRFFTQNWWQNYSNSLMMFGKWCQLHHETFKWIFHWNSNNFWRSFPWKVNQQTSKYLITKYCYDAMTNLFRNAFKSWGWQLAWSLNGFVLKRIICFNEASDYEREEVWKCRRHNSQDECNFNRIQKFRRKGIYKISQSINNIDLEKDFQPFICIINIEWFAYSVRDEWREENGWVGKSKKLNYFCSHETFKGCLMFRGNY